MKTKQQALWWIRKGWKKSKYAKRIGFRLGIDHDGWYGFQCKDFVNAYAEYLGFPFTAGNAEVLWRVNQKGWTKHSRPKPGDVFVMKYVVGGKNYGHTGAVISVQNGTFRSKDQNWFNSSLTVGSPPRVVKHGINEVQGFLRPKGEDMYKGKSAKQWYKKYREEKAKVSWRSKLKRQAEAKLKRIKQILGGK